jgi:glycine/D-amino acid oxidase-like deaminating enzyme
MSTKNNRIAAALLADAALASSLRPAALPEWHAAGEDTFPSHAMPPLDGDTGADVCVIGASFVGLRTAYDLLNKGKTVVVIDCAATLPEQAEREEDARYTRLNDLLTGAGMEEQPEHDHAAPATSSELARAIVRLGGRIYGATRALDVSAEHNMQVVTTYQGAIVARVVVVATDERRLGSGTRGGRGGRGGREQALKPGETPALRVLATPAPDIAALVQPIIGQADL